MSHWLKSPAITSRVGMRVQDLQCYVTDVLEALFAPGDRVVWWDVGCYGKNLPGKVSMSGADRKYFKVIGLGNGKILDLVQLSLFMTATPPYDTPVSNIAITSFLSPETLLGRVETSMVPSMVILSLLIPSLFRKNTLTASAGSSPPVMGQSFRDRRQRWYASSLCSLVL